MLFTFGATILLSSLVSAQNYGGPPPANTPTTAAPVAVPTAPANTAGHVNIDVAFQGNFVFNPPNVTAPVNTSVTFWFPNSGIDHSVTQSSFADPCTYLAASANNSAGFDSGLTNSRQFTIIITDDTKPIWFHCKQVLHCGMGMVGSINANESSPTSYAAFKAAAVKIGSAEVQENDNGAVTGGFNAVASVAPTATGTAAAGGSTGSTGSAMRIGTSAGATLLAALLATMAYY